MKSGTEFHHPWWKGARGEWYVAVQSGLFLLIALGPRDFPDVTAWPSGVAKICTVAGLFMLLTGFLVAASGILRMGKNITPLPYPADHATLLETGPYRIVRHPMYFGAILMAFGWAFFVQGRLTFVYAIILLIFFVFKARREEAWLRDKFSGYAEYQKRVKKLIPYIY